MPETIATIRLSSHISATGKLVSEIGEKLAAVDVGGVTLVGELITRAVREAA